MACAWLLAAVLLSVHILSNGSLTYATRPSGLREAIASLDTAVIAQRIAGVYERVLAKGSS
jgi:hypothetical protein